MAEFDQKRIKNCGSFPWIIWRKHNRRNLNIWLLNVSELFRLTYWKHNFIKYDFNVKILRNILAKLKKPKWLENKKSGFRWWVLLEKTQQILLLRLKYFISITLSRPCSYGLILSHQQHRRSGLRWACEPAPVWKRFRQIDPVTNSFLGSFEERDHRVENRMLGHGWVELFSGWLLTSSSRIFGFEIGLLWLMGCWYI